MLCLKKWKISLREDIFAVLTEADHMYDFIWTIFYEFRQAIPPLHLLVWC